MTRRSLVVDGAERRHRAGLDAEEFAHEFGRAEREPPDAPSRRCSDLSSIAASSSATTRNSAPFLSFRNRFLVCPPPVCAAQRARLLDREQRRMGDRLVRDAEAVEIGEQVVGGGGHRRRFRSARTVLGRRRRRLQSLPLFGIALAAAAAALPSSDAGVAQG